MKENLISALRVGAQQLVRHFTTRIQYESRTKKKEPGPAHIGSFRGRKWKITGKIVRESTYLSKTGTDMHRKLSIKLPKSKIDQARIFFDSGQIVRHDRKNRKIKKRTKQEHRTNRISALRVAVQKSG